MSLTKILMELDRSLPQGCVKTSSTLPDNEHLIVLEDSNGNRGYVVDLYPAPAESLVREAVLKVSEIAPMCADVVVTRGDYVLGGYGPYVDPVVRADFLDDTAWKDLPESEGPDVIDRAPVEGTRPPPVKSSSYIINAWGNQILVSDHNDLAEFGQRVFQAQSKLSSRDIRDVAMQYRATAILMGEPNMPSWVIKNGGEHLNPTCCSKVSARQLRGHVDDDVRRAHQMLCKDLSEAVDVGDVGLVEKLAEAVSELEASVMPDTPAGEGWLWADLFRPAGEEKSTFYEPTEFYDFPGGVRISKDAVASFEGKYVVELEAIIGQDKAQEFRDDPVGTFEGLIKPVQKQVTYVLHHMLGGRRDLNGMHIPITPG